MIIIEKLKVFQIIHDRKNFKVNYFTYLQQANSQLNKPKNTVCNKCNTY